MTQSKLPLSLREHSLLPDNRSHLERALELALAEELYDIEQLFPELLFAQQTPLHALPSLAADKLVPDWSSDDSEQEQRDTADNSWRVHQRAGTIAAIAESMKGLSAEITIDKWFEYGGQPYHFRIMALTTRALDTALAERIARRVDDVKSERDSYELSLGVRDEGRFYFAGASVLAPRVTIR